MIPNPKDQHTSTVEGAWKIQALSIKIDQDTRQWIVDPELEDYRSLQAIASELADKVLQPKTEKTGN